MKNYVAHEQYGVFCYHNYVSCTKALKYMPYAQAGVNLYDDGTIVLISYTTEVIRIEKNVLTCTGLYSMTTRKHISAFLREYCPQFSFYDIKAIANTNKGINVETGELVEV